MPDRLAAPLVDALRALVEWFSAAGVRGTVIGGVAASLQGRPRLTDDVDALVVIDSEVRAVNARRLARLQQQLGRAAKVLEATGWRVRTAARGGVAVRDIVRISVDMHADLIVIGARGASALRRIVLGSVAEAVLDRAALPVLVVR